MALSSFAAKGMREPRDGCVEQGLVSARLAVEYEKPLERFGWTPHETQALQKDVEYLQSTQAIQAEAMGEARTARVDEVEALADAKKFKRTLDKALPLALEDSHNLVDENLFLAGQRLGRSSARYIGWLGKIETGVQKLDPFLTRYFGGVGAEAERMRVLEQLKEADAEQETSLSGVPEKTRQIYEAKGRVVAAVERINRIAAIAFDGQAEIRARFNKDILLRARKSMVERAKKDKQSAAGAPAKAG